MRVAVWLLGMSLAAQSLAGQAIMTGVVHDTSGKRPLEGIEVLLEKSTRSARTDAAGRFTLDSLPSGSQYFLIRSIGYEPVRFRVRVAKRDTIRIEATIVPLGVRLDPIVVIAEPRGPRGIGVEGFEERRAKGFGRFIDSTELRRSEQVRLDDLLRRLATLEVRQVVVRGILRSKAFSRRHVRMDGSSCEMAVLLDGVPIPDPDLKAFEPWALQAVEVYRTAAEVPLEYRGEGAECGMIMLWSRRP